MGHEPIEEETWDKEELLVSFLSVFSWAHIKHYSQFVHFIFRLARLVNITKGW